MTALLQKILVVLGIAAGALGSVALAVSQAGLYNHTPQWLNASVTVLGTVSLIVAKVMDLLGIAKPPAPPAQ
jgi:hypothetical protein